MPHHPCMACARWAIGKISPHVTNTRTKTLHRSKKIHRSDRTSHCKAAASLVSHCMQCRSTCRLCSVSTEEVTGTQRRPARGHVAFVLRVLNAACSPSPCGLTLHRAAPATCFLPGYASSLTVDCLSVCLQRSNFQSTSILHTS